jgi:hypothetical protein
MKVQNTETAHEHIILGKYPLSINFDRCNFYSAEAFTSWATLILFEGMVWAADNKMKEEKRSYSFYLSDLENNTGLPVETCKTELKKLISIGIVTGSAHYEDDFLDDDDHCTGYYELDYERIVNLLPYLLEQPRDTSGEKRYKKITKYFKCMRNNLEELAKEED